MTFKRISTSALILSLAAVPATRAAADGDALVGGIVGGIIGGIIVHEAGKNRRASKPQTTTRSSSGIPAAQRETNRQVQVALNYFGFPVGTADGVLGQRSRAAIRDYQATMGYAPTGELTTFERDHLVGSYHRAQAGGVVTAQQIAAHPMGVRGLLLTYRDEAMGIPGGSAMPAGAPGNPFAAPGTMAGAGAMPVAGAPSPFATVPAAPVMPTAAPAAPEAPAMPTFAAAPAAPEPPSTGQPTVKGGGAAAVSLSSHCSKVAVVTNSNGGYVTQLNMTDPSFALSEQFCLARTYAIAQSEEMIAAIAGFTPQQIAQQCEAFGPVLKEHVAALSLKPRAEVAAGVSSFVLNSGMAPAQLAGTAKICLGVGYTADNMDVAVGSALLLSVLGEAAYGELAGHHLASGIGTAQRADLALAWFEEAIGPAGAETPAVFAPGMADRAGLIRMAAYGVAGKPMPGGSVPGAAPPAAPAKAPGGIKLPSLNLPIFGSKAP